MALRCFVIINGGQCGLTLQQKDPLRYTCGAGHRTLIIGQDTLSQTPNSTARVGQDQSLDVEGIRSRLLICQSRIAQVRAGLARAEQLNNRRELLLREIMQLAQNRDTKSIPVSDQGHWFI